MASAVRDVGPPFRLATLYACSPDLLFDHAAGSACPCRTGDARAVTYSSAPAAARTRCPGSDLAGAGA
eukprot:scaffold1452_cov117-Isochrysis_galbana.AAC.5